MDNVLLVAPADVPISSYTRILASDRIRVAAEIDPDQALQRVRAERLALVAVVVRNANHGLTFVDRVKRESLNPRVPTLLVANWFSPAARGRAAEICDAYLAAPVKPAILAAEVERLTALARLDQAFNAFTRRF